MKAFSIFGNWILFVRKREVSQMAVIYVALIVKGIRTYASVPEVIKPKVKELLEQLELSDLIEG
jgi:hypothetical protein